MSVKPQRVKLIHVPIYSTDEIILSQMPPGSVNQWARTLILRQLQIDAQMLHSFSETVSSGGGEEVTREEVKRVIQDELEPILAQLDDSIDKVIDDKLVGLQQAMMQAVQESIQAALGGQVPRKVEPEPKSEKEIPAWQLSLGKGIEWE